MVLGKLPVPGRPTNLDYSRARASALTVGAGGVVWTFFLSSIISLLSPSLWETARYRLKYCLKGPLSPKQPTNHYPGSSFVKHSVIFIPPEANVVNVLESYVRN